jgi:putative RNA 2'-phosphotransferase
MTPEQVRLSKRISRVLRHAPESAGLVLDAQGWVPVADLLAALRVTRAQLDAVVAGNDKQRFAVETGPGGTERIRASQGHSARVGIDLGLAPATPPVLLFHGTPAANVPSILRAGLRPGRRQHVHLSVDEPTAVAVGRRRSADVAVLAVRAGDLAAAGHVFHRSANGVWLTDAVPPEYVSPR